MSQSPTGIAAETDLRLPSGLSRERLLEAYRMMCLSRALDVQDLDTEPAREGGDRGVGAGARGGAGCDGDGV